MCKVSIEANGLNQEEGKAWVDELANIYADMEIENVSVSGNKITFDAGFSGMDDTQPDDIKMRLDEYLTMNEAFQTKSIKVS
ncbi:MAG: hypothetical protein WAL21_09795 [Nitrososphaeraceae archaeon]|jgi:hypothetical protein|nr:hypothetical protein [Nitrososphaeraceae archaeon]